MKFSLITLTLLISFQSQAFLKDYEYHYEKNICVNKLGEEGFNEYRTSRALKECTDLTLVKNTSLVRTKIRTKKELKGIHFGAINLPKFSFKRKRLIGISFMEANFNRSNFSKTIIDKVFFDKSHFYQGNFKKSKIHNSKLIASNFRRSNFEKGEFLKSQLEDSDFKFSNFKNTKLRDVSFTASNLKNTDFTGAKLHRVDFSKAKMYKADLRNVQCTECKFEGTRLKGALFNEWTILPFSRKEAEESMNMVFVD